MFKNYLTSAWRNLTGNRVYAVISVLGLAIGLAVSILIFWDVNDELTYDRNWPEAKYTCKVNARIKLGDDAFDTWTGIPAPVANLALTDFPEVEQAVRYSVNQISVINGDTPILEKKAAFTEPSFFSVFHIRFLRGNAKTALANVYNIVLSRDGAIKYFGSVENAPGKILKRGGNQQPYTVSAVIENMPQKSSVRFDMLLSLDVVRNSFEGNGDWKTVDEDWGSFGYKTFLVLKPGTTISALENKLSAAHLKHNGYTKQGDVQYILQPLETLRLYNPDRSPAGIKVVQMFTLTGVLILAIAIINYVNLSTARAVKRAKEVGLRRVAGAGRKQLLVQFITEFILIFCFSIIIAVVILTAIIPVYQIISGKSYTIDYWQWSSLKIVLWTALATISLASIYPAWILSSFSPNQVLKAGFSKGPAGGTFRKALVLLQFSFSISLVICTMVVSKQLRYIQQKNVGYNRENVFTTRISGKAGEQIGAIVNELKADRSIADVAFASKQLLEPLGSTDNIDWPGKHNDQAHISVMDVAWNFTDVMKMEFVSGNGFTGAPSDSAYYLVNEAAVNMMELKNPAGTTIQVWGSPRQIKGVLKDFNSNSLKAEVQPTLFRIASTAKWGGVLYVRATSSVKEAVDVTQKVCQSFDRLQPFEYEFMDQAFDALYRKEIQTGTLFRCFAVIAVLLSCMGLFGLSVFTAQRRTKEISIRKVLGASVENISFMLSKEFALLVVLANCIAWPVSWYFMDRWMQEFAYRTTISVWIFPVAGLVALLFAMITVSSQAIKVALINPAKSLRAE